MTTQIIRTKILPPQRHPAAISRAALVGQLLRNPRRKLTLLTAPAGYGKTTLAVEWIHHLDKPVSWLSLDPSDNDPLQFLTYLAYTAQTAFPEFNPGIITKHESLPSPDLSSFTKDFINEIHKQATQGVIILDDCHFLTADEIWESLTLLIENQPRNLHIGLITRTDPPLALPRLRVRQEIEEFRADQLKFTEEEVATYFTHALEAKLSKADTQLLVQQTDGWAAALQLAVISLREDSSFAGFIETYSGENPLLFDYLSEEVLSYISPELLQFLLEISLPDRFCAQLCTAITGNPTSASLIQTLEERNLFINPLDENHHWYRLHTLFRDALNKRRQQLGPFDERGIYLKASQWFEAQGLITEAVDYAQRSGSNDRTTQLIERHSLTAIREGHVYLANKWISSLPQATQESNLRIGLNQGWLHILTGKFDKLPGTIHQIEQRTEIPQPLLGELLTLKAFMAPTDPVRMQGLAQQALEILDQENPFALGLVHMALANAYQLQGEKHKAYDEFGQAISVHCQANNRVAAVNGLMDLVELSLTLGRWKETAQAIQTILADAEQQGALDEPAMGMAFISQGLTQLYQYQPADLIQVIEKGIQLAELGGYQLRHLGQIALAEALILEHRQGEARTVLDKFINGLPMVPALFHSFYQLLAADVYLHLDDLEQAASLLKGLALEQNDHLTLIRLEIALRGLWEKEHQAVPTQTITSLTDLVTHFADHQWTGYEVEGRLLLMEAHLIAGESKSALAELETALEKARADQIRLPFIKRARLLTQAHLPPGSDPLISKLKNELATYTQAGTTNLLRQAELAEPLSDREYQVLQYLMAGQTYQMIAEKLFVSINTVRYHVKGLYGKLGVSNKSEAIRKARAMNILKS